MNTEFKIYLVVVTIIFIFIGYCIYTVESNQEAEKKECSKQTENSKTAIREYFDGHYYIIFSPNYYKMGVIHDPDCPCKNNKIKPCNFK